MKKLFLTLSTLAAFGLYTAMAQVPSIIDEALSVNNMTEGRDSAIKAFNEKYLIVNDGSSLCIPKHLLFPDSTFYGANSLTDNILPLAFGFVPDKVREDVINNVVATIRKNKYRADVDPRVEPFVLKTLAAVGHNEMAYFLYEEHPEMETNSSISEEYQREWLETCVAGITTIEGKRKVKIRIRPDFSIQELDTLSWEAETPYGKVSSRFEKDLMRAEWYFSIPKGVKAEIYTPTAIRKNVRKRCFARRIRIENGCSVWKVRSGEHHFSIKFDLPEYVVDRKFVYKNEPFPQCHGSSICVAENGDLISTFYGGTAEHNPDTKAYISRQVVGSDSFTKPVAVAEPDIERYCLDNPVVFRIPEPGEPLLLFYKIRPGYHIQENNIDLGTISMWVARMKKSYDNGLTWSEMTKLPDGFLGPVKDKPIYKDGRIICGSSYESKFHHEGTRIHFEYTDDKCETWHFTRPDTCELSIPCELRKVGRTGENVDVPANPDYYYGNYWPIFSIQPTIFVHKDGSLQALCRTANGKMSTTKSFDNGATWTKETLTDMPQNGSGIDGTTMKDGRFVLVYNKFESLPGKGGGPRTPLVVAISDDCEHWTDIVTLEDDAIKEYSYPAIVCDDNGDLHITYTWRRYRVKYVKLHIPSTAKQ